MKSVKNNSPTDSEKQTAVASKHKGLFLTKLSLCQILTMLVKTPPVSSEQRCAFSVCEPDNMNSHVTNKNHTGPKWVCTQEPEEEQQSPKTPSCLTPSLPTKAAKAALELAVALLPASLHPLITHFGHKIIMAHCKQYAKESITQRMEQDKNYIPRSAKATDFKITLSNGAKEDEERVSFLELQIQQTKDSYESALKHVIEECITLEIQAAKKEETQLIMDLLLTIGTTIQKLQGIECNEHVQMVNVLKIAPTLLQCGPISTMNTFLAFYQTYHSLDDVSNPTIRTMEDEYPTVEECTKAMHFHTALLQRSENSGIQTYVKCLESILTIPTTSYNKQIEENK